MKIFRSPDCVDAGFGPSAVTIGKFDGVHRGHRAVIDSLRKAAAEQGLASAVVTFDRNPLEILAPQKCPTSLVSLGQKLDLLQDTGVDAALILHFDRDLAALAPADFVDKVLLGALEARVLFVGRDFRFGAKGAGDVSLLHEMGEREGFEVKLIEDVSQVGEGRVSSTRIRTLLKSGEVRAAAGLLGRTATVRGVVVHGAKRGRALGFPTANLSPELEGLIPGDGVYAGWLSVEGTRYPAAISVGNNPTFEGVAQKQVEAHVLDRDVDLYDRIVEVSFVERIRTMMTFEGIEPLINRMRDDVAEARTALRM